MKFGFTSTSFRQIRSIDRITRIAVDSGAQIIEWADKFHVTDEQSAKYAKKSCDDSGIEISSYGTYYRVGSNDSQRWKQICELSSIMNCGSVRVWLGNEGSARTTEKVYQNILEDTVKICETAKEYGLIVCPECHDRTYNDNTDAFLKLYDDSGCDNLGTYFQSRYKKQEYDLDRIKRTLPYIESVHISYSEQVREQFPHRNSKYIDILLKKLISSGFDGNFLVEYTYLFGWAGIPSMMVRDVNRIRNKAGELR